MTIIRGAGPGDAVVAVLRAAAQDSRLSFRARGILVSVMSRPEEWRTGYRQLAEEAREGERAVLNALRELEQYGYLRRARVHNGRHVITVWEMSDNPSRRTGGRLLQPTKQQPTKQQPTKQQPTKQQPAKQQPDQLQPVLKGERKGEIPPPTPAGALPVFPDVDGLVGVVVGVLRKTKTPVPAQVGLRRECSRLTHLQWTAAQLQAAVEGHDWSGARAGAVITFLRQLQAPSVAPERGQERPVWCGSCDESTRTVDGPPSGPRNYSSVIPCPTCHPKSRKDTA